MASNSLTSRFVRILQEITPDSIPDEAHEVARQACLDGFAVMLAGSTEPLGVGRLVTEWVVECAGAPQASVIASGVKVPTYAAAFANGTMAHALDFDNYWYPRNHPTSPTLPAILALAEHYGFSGRQVTSALVVAFESQVRLRMASVGLDTGVGFHKPGMTGTMGATAATAWLLGLDATQMAHALGIAGSRAGSLAINTGTMTKSSHSGHAARMAVESAELAKRGWTASTEVFDSGGFFDTFMGDRHEPELLVENFGKPYYMVNPGIGFKKYPCNGFTQRPIDAALELRRLHEFEVKDVQKIEVDIPPFNYVNRPRPKTGLDGKFSIQYTTCVALLDNKVTVDSFSNERRFSPDVENLLSKTELVYDDSISMSALETLVRLRVHLVDGRTLSSTKQEITGMVGVPLARADRLAKFYSCAERVLPIELADEAVSLIEGLNELSDVRRLMEIVGQTAKTS